ncbi:hypothetical protein H0H92_000442, partial [Tricholoma furcatifolium]
YRGSKCFSTYTSINPVRHKASPPNAPLFYLVFLGFYLLLGDFDRELHSSSFAMPLTLSNSTPLTAMLTTVDNGEDQASIRKNTKSTFDTFDTLKST